jgi:hypothetical protein
MIRVVFFILLLIHGLIHLMGFAKAFGYGNITQLTKDISKPAGACWLIAAMAFIAAAIIFLLNKESWPVIVFFAVILSQLLIVAVWKDAKFGTIANLILLAVAVATWGSHHFEATFIKDVKKHIQEAASLQVEVLKEQDIQLLPLPVQKYLRYSGVLHQPKVKNVRIAFDGEMRGKGKDWFTFQSVQYNFFDDPARLFFMKATMAGINVPGYHDYQQATARMNVKLFGLIPVMKAGGPAMNKAETVTLFNDMCLMAPATLIDKRIEWETIDSLSARAVFTNGVNKITAILYFNQQGQLINFISDDRFEINAMKQYRFSTPVKDYRLMNGRNCMKYGEAVWHYPDGEFVYGKFNLKNIEYNVADFNP